MEVERGMLRRHAASITVAITLLDLLMCVGGALFAYFLYFGTVVVPFSYQVLVLLGVLLVAVGFPLFNVYRPWRAQRFWAPATRVGVAWAVLFTVLLVMLVLSKHAATYSRVWMGLWFFLSLGMYLTLRLAAFSALKTLRRRGFNSKNVVIVGNGEHARNLVERAQTEDWAGYRIVAIADAQIADEMAGDVPLIPLNTLPEMSEKADVDEVWIALPLEHTREIGHVLSLLRFSTANVRYAPDLFGIYLLNHGMTDILDVPMIDLATTPIQGVNRGLKAIEDWVMACIALVIFSPVMLVIAVLVKLTSQGPVIFKQARHGWDGREIIVYKFRTMHAHDEVGGSVTQARVGDTRVTRVGSFLRRTSLDELPQFINVLQGRMSIVGPRPHAIEHNLEYRELIERYALRHKVKPGITGWAQVNGLRGETETVEKMEKRIEHDLYYIGNWSLLFDIKIIWLTLRCGFSDPHAY